MPSADFCSAVRLPLSSLSRHSDTEQISWGLKNSYTGGLRTERSGDDGRASDEYVGAGDFFDPPSDAVRGGDLSDRDDDGAGDHKSAGQEATFQIEGVTLRMNLGRVYCFFRNSLRSLYELAISDSIK